MPSTDPHEAAAPHTISPGAVTELDADPWLTAGEAAKYMHMSISSMRRYDTPAKGKPPVLPASRTPGGQRRWRKSQLDAWLNQNASAA